MRKRFALPLLAWLYAGGVLAAPPAAVADGRALPLAAVAVPLDPGTPARERVGALRYRGGVALTSTDPAFGGLSALRIGPGGWALSVSDTGNWVTFRLIERGGRLVGARDGWIAPLRDTAGRPPLNKDLGDAEALDWDRATGVATVVFEQDHRFQHYAGIDPARPASLAAPARAVERHPLMRGWQANGGGEAFAWVDGVPTVIAEAGPPARRTMLQRFGALTVVSEYPNPPGFSPTDMAAERGTLTIVNRRFAAAEGPGAVIVRWRRGAPPEELARLTRPLTVDNYEGLALTRRGGRRFLYVLSDDNFNPMQRTLLLKFEVVG